MDRVDEELGPAAVGLARIRHGQGAWVVGELVILRVLILNRAMWRAARTAAGAGRIRTVGAAELNHEVRNDPVEV